MQHPVATVVSSSPPSAPPLWDARRLLLPRRLRRHQPQRSRSSSPELSHPSNCPSSGGASPMASPHLLVLPRAREPDRLRITFTARADDRQPARRCPHGTAEQPPEIPRALPPSRQRRDPAPPPKSGRITPGPGCPPRDPAASGASLARGAPQQHLPSPPPTETATPHRQGTRRRAPRLTAAEPSRAEPRRYPPSTAEDAAAAAAAVV
ncbi:unnamed protein product [Urochloa humidicola]